MFLFEHYIQKTKSVFAAIKPMAPVADWPEEWKITYAKTYPRFKLIQLPKPTDAQNSISLWSALTKRQSQRQFTNQLSAQTLSDWLYYTLGTKSPIVDDESPRRMYPSGGALYPHEAYLLILKPMADIIPGVYHYDLKSHGLRLINPETITTEELVAATGQNHLSSAQGVLFLTGIWQRNSKKYGELAYKFLLIEAGGIMHNAGLNATALNFSTCQVGSFASDLAESLLGIDGYQEIVVHQLFFG